MGNCARHHGDVTVEPADSNVSKVGADQPTYRSFDDLSQITASDSLQTSDGRSSSAHHEEKRRGKRGFFGKVRRMKATSFLNSRRVSPDEEARSHRNMPEILITSPGGVCRKVTSVGMGDENQNISHFVAYTQIDVPEVALGSYLLRQFDLHGDQVAVIDAQSDECYRYRDLAEHTRQIASALWKRGFRTGHTLVVVSSNSPEIAAVVCATLCSGGKCAVIDPSISVAKLSRRIREVRPMVVITEASLGDTLLRSTANAGILTEIYTIGHAEGFHPLKELKEDNGSCFPTATKIQPRKTCALILFTSQEDGTSRGVELSHYNVLSNMLQVQATLSVKRGCSLGCFLSLSDHFGLVTSFLCGFVAGAKVVLVTEPSMEHCITALIKYKPRCIHISPELAVTMFEDDMMSLCDLSQLESLLCGPDPLPANVQTSLSLRVQPAKVYQAYGSLSTLVTHCGCPLDASPDGSSGNLVPNTLCKIVERGTGRSLYANSRGEIWVRGPQCMMGYLNNIDGSNGPSDDWIFTGDMGKVDVKGNLFVESSASTEDGYPSTRRL